MSVPGLPLWIAKASMGPRLCRRGNGCEQMYLSTANPPLQWGHVFVDVEIMSCVRSLISSVMSASMGPRLCRRGNVLRGRQDHVYPGKLQWGHVFVDVEMMNIAKFVKKPNQASMGPRLCRRGNPRQSGSILLLTLSFNGATSL